MRNCDLEKLLFDKVSKKYFRSGEIITVLVEDMYDDLLGKIIELKKKRGLWSVKEVYEQDVQSFKIKKILSS